MKQHDSYKEESATPGERSGHDLGGNGSASLETEKVLFIDQSNGY